MRGLVIAALVLLGLAATTACRPNQAEPTSKPQTHDIAGTVAAQVQATVQTL
jgi:hypothetical protein